MDITVKVKVQVKNVPNEEIVKELLLIEVVLVVFHRSILEDKYYL